MGNRGLSKLQAILDNFCIQSFLWYCYILFNTILDSLNDMHLQVIMVVVFINENKSNPAPDDEYSHHDSLQGCLREEISH